MDAFLHGNDRFFCDLRDFWLYGGGSRRMFGFVFDGPLSKILVITCV